ncbi:MAG TPA: alpha/beta fold hydrolase [Dehalococcoidia bacterium]|nr:alpha/beta fold hydrolase [Dehalococcoidia bacterium]
MPYAPAGDTQIYYELRGRKPADAPAIVFAHGAGGNHLSWWQQVPHFRDRFACLTFDHRGFGLSRDDAGRGGAAFADDLRALLDHAGIERATLVAQSLGGWTCLAFALRWPERVQRLVMCDTHGGLACDEINAAWGAALRTPPGLPPGVHPAAGARMAAEQPALAFLYAEIDALNPPRERAEITALLRAAGAPTPDDVARLAMPVLCIVGEEDVVIPPSVIEIFAAYVPGSRVARVAHAGHSVYFERAAACNAILDGFFADTG